MDIDIEGVDGIDIGIEGVILDFGGRPRFLGLVDLETILFFGEAKVDVDDDVRVDKVDVNGNGKVPGCDVDVDVNAEVVVDGKEEVEVEVVDDACEGVTEGELEEEEEERLIPATKRIQQINKK